MILSVNKREKQRNDGDTSATSKPGGVLNGELAYGWNTLSIIAVFAGRKVVICQWKLLKALRSRSLDCGANVGRNLLDKKEI